MIDDLIKEIEQFIIPQQYYDFNIAGLEEILNKYKDLDKYSNHDNYCQHLKECRDNNLDGDCIWGEYATMVKSNVRLSLKKDELKKYQKAWKELKERVIKEQKEVAYKQYHEELSVWDGYEITFGLIKELEEKNNIK